MAWDATIIHTCTLNYLLSFWEAAAAVAKSHKAQKYGNLRDQYNFRPLGVEIIGAFGPKALELVELFVCMFERQSSENGARTGIYLRLAAVKADYTRRAKLRQALGAIVQLSGCNAPRSSPPLYNRPDLFALSRLFTYLDVFMPV